MVLERRGVQESWLMFWGSPSPSSVVVRPHVQTVKQRWSFPLPQHWGGHTWNATSNLGSPVWKRHGHTVESSVKGHEYGKWTGAFVIQGKAEQDRIVQPQERKALGWRGLDVYKHPFWGGKEDGGRFFSMMPGQRNKEHRLEYREFFSNKKGGISFWMPLFTWFIWRT